MSCAKNRFFSDRWARIALQKCLNKSIVIASGRRNTILQLSTPTHTLSPQTSHLLNHKRWCHLANKLKPYRRNFHVWNSHRRRAVWLHTAGPFQTTDSFSAIADCLVFLTTLSVYFDVVIVLHRSSFPCRCCSCMTKHKRVLRQIMSSSHSNCPSSALFSPSIELISYSFACYQSIGHSFYAQRTKLWFCTKGVSADVSFECWWSKRRRQTVVNSSATIQRFTSNSLWRLTPWYPRFHFKKFYLVDHISWELVMMMKKNKDKNDKKYSSFRLLEMLTSTPCVKKEAPYSYP